MHRIDWTDNGGGDDDDDDDDDGEAKRRVQSEVCKVVWEGYVVKQHFKTFRVEAARTSDAARKLLKERNCEHYWDMARTDGLEGRPDEDVDVSEDADSDEDSGGEEAADGEMEEQDGLGGEEHANGSAEAVEQDADMER
jgi:hypothetical protein